MPYERRLGSAVLRATLLAEDAAQAGLVRLLGLLGRREVTVLPFIGHGTPQRLRARGRVVLGRSPARPVTADLGDVPREGVPADSVPADASSAEDASSVDASSVDASPADASSADNSLADSVPADSVPRGGRWAGWRERWGTFRESAAPFLTIEVPGCPVVVRGPVDATAAHADRQGYLDVPVDAGGLPPGWHRVSVTATWRGRSAEATVPVLIIDPGAPLAVVSDVDDTVIESGITRGLQVLRLTLMTKVTRRTPLPGAAELYRALTAPRDSAGPAPVFYLSTSPWNLYELLTRFLVLRGFPAGPLLLTDWGPSRTNLFRVPTEEHKLTLIRALLAEHPALQVVLIGDTGQLDPEIYATIVQEAPDRVRAIYVRRTVGMASRRAIELQGLTRRVAASGVPMLVVDDSVQIAYHAAQIGLLGAADVQAVRAAT